MTRWARIAIGVVGFTAIVSVLAMMYLIARPRPYIDPSFPPAEQEFLRREMALAGKLDNFVIVDDKGVAHANRRDLLKKIEPSKIPDLP